MTGETKPPFTSLDQSLIDKVCKPLCEFYAEGQEHWSELRTQIEAGRISGPRVHDARIVALCLAHGVRELWTADRDFSRFADLATANPLTG